MGRKRTYVGAVDDVRQLNGVVGGCRDSYQCGWKQFAANIVRESCKDCERGGQHVRVGVGEAIGKKRVITANGDRCWKTYTTLN